MSYKISKLDKISEEQLYVIYLPHLSVEFGVFISDLGQTKDIKEAKKMNIEEAQKLKQNWEAMNSPKNARIVPLQGYQTIEVIPVGNLDRVITDFE